VSRARSMLRRMPVIEVLDGHHSMMMETFLKMDRICVSVVQNSREKDRRGWGRKLVVAWMAARLVERIVMRGLVATEAGAQRSASQSQWQRSQASVSNGWFRGCW